MTDRKERHDDPEAPPSAEEAKAAESLRAGLEAGSRPSETAELARSLAAAWEPRDLAPAEHRKLARAAVARRGPGRVVRMSFGAAAVLALAASVVLVLWNSRGPIGAATPLAASRSTQELFPSTFAAQGGETSRIDRIAMARAADLRENEFALWGVR